MTDAEVQKAQSDAHRDAIAIGGIIAILLIRKNRRRVTFDSATLRFFVDGQPVSLDAIRQSLEKLYLRQAAVINRATDELTSGTITVDEWLEQMRAVTASTHTIAGAMAAGSIATALALSTVRNRIDEQWLFLSRFADDLGTTAPDKQISPRRAQVRARSYLQAARITFASIELAVRKHAGNTEAKRVLTMAEHCVNSLAASGCLELARLSWMPIDEMVPIGQATCGRYCKCFIVYR